MKRFLNFRDKVRDVLFKKGALYVIIGNFSTKFITYFGSVFLIWILTKETYGLVEYVENIYGYIYIFAGFGMGISIIRFIVSAKNENEEKGYFNYAIKNGFIFNIVLLIFALIFAYLYPHPVEFVSTRWLLCILLFALPFQNFIDISLSTFRGKFDNKSFAIFSVLFALLLLLFKFFGALIYSLDGAIIGRLFLTLLFSIGILLFTYKHYFTIASNYVITKEKRREIRNYSIQYMFTNSIWAIFMLNNIFLIGVILRNSSLIADYKAAYVLPGAIAVISSAIGYFVAPYFIRNEKNYKWVRKNFKALYLTGIVIIGIISLLIYILSPILISLIFGDRYTNIVNLMRMLVISSFINNAFRYPISNVLSAMGKIKQNLIISIVGVIGQILLNILFLSKVGIMMIPISNIIVYSIMAIFLLIVFNKQFYTKTETN
ncbi:MAG: oligosaccharide flippase family protein [Candidatus Izemoplasmatales bacterium]|jgi:O-antigen/teichoic acid export membrane protein